MFRTVKLYSILFQNKEDLYFQTDIDDSYSEQEIFRVSLSENTNLLYFKKGCYKV